jgi:hypothetical protein
MEALRNTPPSLRQPLRGVAGQLETEEAVPSPQQWENGNNCDGFSAITKLN